MKLTGVADALKAAARRLGTQTIAQRLGTQATAQAQRLAFLASALPLH